MTGKRPVRLLGACLLLAGGVGTSVLLSAGAGQAAACGSATVAGTPCTLTGTLTLISGSLTLTSPTALTWSGTLNGLDLHLVDATVAHQSYLVDDATGTATGWHVTVSATTFTTTGSLTLANTGTFVTNGSITSVTATVPPTAACLSGSRCTLPTNTTTYPVAITTAASAPAAVTIYDTSAGSGLGSINIGAPGTNPVGWWLNVPSNTTPGTYTSTVTLEIIAGP